MRLTCLRCGHQLELPTVPVGPRQQCPGCALDYTYPEVHNTGVRPSERAAERSRTRAFRAAGLVKNTGGFALGLSGLGVLFPPLGLAGAGLGAYVLARLRGPMGRYSGRRNAVLAIVLGLGAVVTWSYAIGSWMEERRVRRIADIQSHVDPDLRSLVRAERLFRAGKDTYAGFGRLQLANQSNTYTLYLGPTDVMPAKRDGQEITDPLPEGLSPGYSETAFTAVAVANVDDDADLDVWVVDDTGQIRHVRDDLAEKKP